MGRHIDQIDEINNRASCATLTSIPIGFNPLLSCSASHHPCALRELEQARPDKRGEQPERVPGFLQVSVSRHAARAQSKNGDPR